MPGKLSHLTGWAAIKGVYLNKRHLNDALIEKLQQQIEESEARHSAEFVLAFEPVLPSHIHRPRDRALEVFGRLGVWDTPHNTGLLLYICFDHQAIEIIADRGIQAAPGSWERICHHLAQDFRQGRYVEGMENIIEEITRILAECCPQSEEESGSNALPNRPVVL